MTEKEAINELLNMSKEELDLVQYYKVKLICSGKNCQRITHVRDYGIHPIYYHPRFTKGWHDITQEFFACAKHWKIYKRLLKKFNQSAVYFKLFDPNKNVIIK